MIHTAFLTDYTNRLYTTPSKHSNLKLFLTLCPGSEIITAQYDCAPDDLHDNWFNYKFKVADRKFVLLEDDLDFKNTAIKLNLYLSLWNDVINKLNFIYDKESSPFKFNEYPDLELIETLKLCQKRCEEILIENYYSGNINKARFNIDRETFNNILL
jgi:hypothetical protein